MTADNGYLDGVMLAVRTMTLSCRATYVISMWQRTLRAGGDTQDELL